MPEYTSYSIQRIIVHSVLHSECKKKRTTWIRIFTIAFIYLFLCFFVPNSFYTGLLADVFSAPFLYIVMYFAAPGVLSFIASWFIDVIDFVETGSSELSKFFEYYYTTSKLKSKIPSISDSKSKQFFFDEFNSWQTEVPRKSNYNLAATIFERTSNLRIVCTAMRLSGFFFCLAFVVLLCEGLFALYGNDIIFFDKVYLKTTYMSVCAGIYLLLWNFNKFWITDRKDDYFDKYNATGVFKKYIEIQKRAWEQFKKSKSYTTTYKQFKNGTLKDTSID